jgi:hypothetical protein
VVGDEYETSARAAAGGEDPRPAAVTLVTTEHFTLKERRFAVAADDHEQRYLRLRIRVVDSLAAVWRPE